jgi:chromosome segregation ATPase
MSQHPDEPRETSDQQPAGAPDAAPAAARRPNLSGDLEELLLTAPAFRRRLLGYDRLQVDNYVAWAEAVQRTSRQETDDLLDRYGRCCAELEAARRVLVHSSEGQQMGRVTERIGSMLQLAADEAADVTATAQAEAERLRDDARDEADRQQRRAQEAAAARQQAERDAAELTQRSAEERTRLDEEAAQVRDRLDREAAERRDRDAATAAATVRQQFASAREQWDAAEAAARQRQTRLEDELAELERRRGAARTALTRMSHQVNDAVATLAETFPVPGLRLAPPPRIGAEDHPVTARHHAGARGGTPAS